MIETFVIGGGLAGLGAALPLADAGHKVTLLEAGPACGGRCRSYVDRELGVTIDNGNHLLLSGNRAAFAFLDKLGSRDTLYSPPSPQFPFYDLKTGRHWTLAPSAGRVPWWLFDPARRAPATRPADYLKPLRLAWSRGTVAQSWPDPDALYTQLIAPIAISALNTPLDTASARLLFAVMRETLFAGGAALLPAFPAHGLSASFIDPALAYLTTRGATIRTSTRVQALHLTNDRVRGLSLPDGEIILPANANIVLAVPPNIAVQLLPGITAPDEFESILNVHYAITVPPNAAGFTGILNGLTEWVFTKPNVTSITTSAANRLINDSADDLAARIWPEIRAALSLDPVAPLPAYRVVKEKRATFAATPAMEKRRPRTDAGPRNLALAGDWTDTGLPATIEGAIRSGQKAAHYLLTGASPRPHFWQRNHA